MQTNEVRNAIVHYSRAANGSITETDRTPTGGAGSGVFKPISGQESAPNTFEGAASVILSPDRRFLFTINGGDNSVSSFAVAEDGRMTLLDVKPTGNAVTGRSGTAKSLAYLPAKNLLYVLHSFGPDHLRLMSVDPVGKLTSRPRISIHHAPSIARLRCTGRKNTQSAQARTTSPRMPTTHPSTPTRSVVPAAASVAEGELGWDRIGEATETPPALPEPALRWRGQATVPPELAGDRLRLRVVGQEVWVRDETRALGYRPVYVETLGLGGDVSGTCPEPGARELERRPSSHRRGSTPCLRRRRVGREVAAEGARRPRGAGRRPEGIARLLAADRRLAQAAIDDAVGRGADPARARKMMEDAQEQIDRGEFPGAIDDFEEAWKEALKAGR